jgi:MFS family permease
VRAVVVTGILLEVIGMLLTSFATQFWHLILAQGLCVGVRCGALAFTSAAIIPFYFTKRRMLAAGTVSTGSSIGESMRLWVMEIVLTRCDSWGCVPSYDAGTLC